MKGAVSVLGGLAVLLASVSLAPITDAGAWAAVAILLSVAVVAGGEVLRRLGAGELLTCTLVTLLSLHTAALLTVGGSGTWWGLPTTEWFRRVTSSVQVAIDDLSEFPAPVPGSPGLSLILTSAVVIAAVVVGHVVATDRVVWAAAPLLGLHLVGAIGIPGGVAWPGFFLAALGFAALVLADDAVRTRQWGQAIASGTDRHRSAAPDIWALGGGPRLALAAAACAVGVAAIVPAVPAVLGGGGGAGGTLVRTTNPIADLQRDLVRPDDIELLRYNTDSGSREYLRVVSLDIFDGTTWRTSDRAVPESQRVSEGLPDIAPGRSGVAADALETASYGIAVSDSYESQWLPTPYAPRAVLIDGDWRYDAATLDIVAFEGDTRGSSYEVTAEVFTPTQDALEASSSPSASDFGPLLSVPTQVSAQLSDVASEVKGDAATPYEQAAQLQRWFRSDGGFRYDVSVSPGTSNDALADFLDQRVGYCEQFAATMALMARTLGIPARVAVGFLPGERTDDGAWIVSAHDSHAWPELYFDRLGWVRFEPTPAVQTGAPPSWTVPGNATQGGEAGPELPEAAAPSSAVRVPDLPEEGGAVELTGPGVQVPWRWLGVGALVTVVAALPAFVASVVRRRRRSRTVTNGQAAEVAWAEITEAAADADRPLPTGRSPRATAQAAHAAFAEEPAWTGAVQESLARVVTAVERTRYGAGTQTLPRGAEVEQLFTDADQIVEAVRESMSWRYKLPSALWPAALPAAFRVRGRRGDDASGLPPG